MDARFVTFSAVKQGLDDEDWEDGAAWHPGDTATGRNPRLAVADGATGGFAAAQWAAQLVDGFVGAEGPALEPPALHRWLAAEQEGWRQHPGWGELNQFARMALERGSFATVLGCEIRDLTGPRPRWTAFALGDTVLFHVRDHALVAHFPPIPAADFGFNPDGVPTRPGGLAEMTARLQLAGGELADGDLLFVATDALAHWMLSVDPRDHATLWARLADLDHPVTFARIVEELRGSHALHNDDVTLMRVLVTAAAPTLLAVCL